MSEHTLDVDDVVAVRTERMATGGEAVARPEHGPVVFVRGALPDESVSVRITEVRKRFARGEVTEIHDAAVARIEAGCAHAADGSCGGCDWITVEPAAQRTFKQALVVEQLQRLGGVAQPNVAHHDGPAGLRSTVRCLVTDGRAGYRSRRSNAGFAAESCRAVEPAVEELIVDGRYPGADEVMIRVGVGTGQRLVVVEGDASAVRVPDDVTVVERASLNTVEADDTATPVGIDEIVAGRSWWISAGSFFQASVAGAEALVAAVADLGADVLARDGSVVDLYGGVGLLGGGACGDRLHTLVESNPAACADARRNLGAGVVVEQARVERWRATEPFDMVIADPARRGLGAGGVEAVESCQAGVLVLVSCDPASLGRDVGLLQANGWRYDRSTVVDLFPDTSRIEVVSRLVRDEQVPSISD